MWHRVRAQSPCLKYDTKEPSYKIDRFTQRIDLWLPKWELEEKWVGSLGLADANYCIYRMDK